MPKQPRPQLHIDAVRGVGENVCAQGRQDAFKDRYDDKADNQHIERGQAAMHQHLVDDHLKEERRHKREELQEERRHQNFHQHRTVFMHRLQEPGDVKPPDQFAEASAASHQDKTSAPLCFKLGA